MGVFGLTPCPLTLAIPVSQCQQLQLFVLQYIIGMDIKGAAPIVQETVEQMDSLLDTIKKSEWRKSIARCLREYNLKIYNLNKLTPLRAKELHSVIVNKFYKSNKNRDHWNENELRLFVWMTFAYGGAVEKNPELFEIDDWAHISRCFAGKIPLFCEFQFKCLKKISESSDQWTNREEDILRGIVERQEGEDSKKLKWNDIAREFYANSNKTYFRTAKQCREHWNTYLDPNKLKSPWSYQEDLLLARTVATSGKKWSKISQLLSNKRSEHTVKNRYNSLISKYIKANNLSQQKDSVAGESLCDWLVTRSNPQDPNTLTTIQPLRRTDQQIGPTSPLYPESLGMQQSLKEQQKFNYPQVITSTASHSLVENVQSPTMLISPLPMSFGPILFSPLGIYYRTDNDRNFNMFSFQSMMRPS